MVHVRIRCVLVRLAGLAVCVTSLTVTYDVMLTATVTMAPVSVREAGMANTVHSVMHLSISNSVGPHSRL